MKRRLLIALLALGTLGGYGAGVASMRCHRQARRDAWERHVARVCIDAARSSKDAPAPGRDEPGDW
jgi:hypothetical protein